MGPETLLLHPSWQKEKKNHLESLDQGGEGDHTFGSTKTLSTTVDDPSRDPADYFDCSRRIPGPESSRHRFRHSRGGR